MQDDSGTERPAPVGSEKWIAKHDQTTRTAMDIIERERADREAKTARLRAARIAREAETTAAPNPG